MKTLYIILIFVFFCQITFGQVNQIPTTCFEIESILVDACVRSDSGYVEGANEMFRFRTGNNSLNIQDMEVGWPGTSEWQGVVQDFETSILTSYLNTKIISCGILIEPLDGIIPPKSNVLLITSAAVEFDGGLYFDTESTDFSDLTDSLYIIFQKCHITTLQAGYFKNYTSSVTPVNRSLKVRFNIPANCADTVTYDCSKLIGDELGFHNGDCVDFSWSGIANYTNKNCKIPIDPLQIFASLFGDTTKTNFCINDTIKLFNKVTGEYFSYNWLGGNGGIFQQVNDTLTNYIPALNELGVTTFTFSGYTNCDTITNEINITYSNCLGINETKNSNFSIFPNPTIGILNIKFENIEKETQIKVLDISEREIISNKISSNTKEFQLDLSNLSKGIYFVKLQNGNDFKVEKIVLE